MIQNRLRLYCGPDASGTASVAETKQTAKTSRSPPERFSPGWRTPHKTDRAWLRDFEDDQITISSDLYEVILAYQHFRRPSA